MTNIEILNIIKFVINLTNVLELLSYYFQLGFKKRDNKMWMENVPQNMNTIKEFLILLDKFNSKMNEIDNSFQFHINEKNLQILIARMKELELNNLFNFDPYKKALILNNNEY